MSMKYKRYQCGLCGKFRKVTDIFAATGEGDEYWIECKFCCSDADFERFFKNETRDSIGQASQEKR